MDHKIEKEDFCLLKKILSTVVNRKFVRKDSVNKCKDTKKFGISKSLKRDAEITRVPDKSEFCCVFSIPRHQSNSLPTNTRWLTPWLNISWRMEESNNGAINVIKFCAIQISDTIINTDYKIKLRSEHISYYRFVQYNFDIKVIFERDSGGRKKSTLKSFDNRNRSNNIVRLKLKIR